MSENPVDPSISPESVPDPDGDDDGEHPSNPDKTGESIDNASAPADDPEGEHWDVDPVA